MLNRVFAQLRAREFPSLDRERLVYLDYTGAALPSRSQLRAHQALVAGAPLGNPHADHAPSRASTAVIAQVRAAILRFLDADPDEYGVCFTANASAAAKLVGEGFRFGRSGLLALSADNHNSMNGLREYAARAGAGLRTLPLTAELRLDEPREHLGRRGARGHRLLAIPAQSNFSGVRHPLSLVREAQQLGYAVLLDAAAFVPTSHLSLQRIKPEFVTLSFSTRCSGFRPVWAPWWRDGMPCSSWSGRGLPVGRSTGCRSGTAVISHVGHSKRSRTGRRTTTESPRSGRGSHF